MEIAGQALVEIKPQERLVVQILRSDHSPRRERVIAWDGSGLTSSEQRGGARSVWWGSARPQQLQYFAEPTRAMRQAAWYRAC